MDKEMFNRLEISDQINEFNKLIKEHGGIRKACEILGVGRTTVRDRFKKAGYVSTGNEYIKNTDTPIEGQTSLVEPVSENKQHIESNKIETDLKHDDLEKLIEQKIEEMLNKRLNKQIDNGKFANKIVISSRCEGGDRSRSFQVYANVLDEFIVFCQKTPYTLKDLVSQAMVEFMENHK